MIIKVEYLNCVRCGNLIHVSYKYNDVISSFETHLFDLYDIISHIYDIENSKKFELEEYIDD